MQERERRSLSPVGAEPLRMPPAGAVPAAAPGLPPSRVPPRAGGVGGPRRLLRSCACGGGGGGGGCACPGKSPGELLQSLQRSPLAAAQRPSAAPAVAPAVGSGIRAAAGGGRPLDAGARERLGPLLGDPLGDVRVHTDAAADALAGAVSARAFTAGSDVFFAAGQYRPGSRAGDALIAHESVHVLQQRGASAAGGLTVSDPSEPLEQEAEAVASSLAGGHAPLGLPASVRPAAAALRVARQHSPGGPYHPPEGTEMSCSMADDCSSLSTKINYLKHTIASHQQWDAANPNPAYPNGRHYDEIQDLLRALANCKQIANTKCTGQPEWHPVPVVDPAVRREQVEQQIRDALPWAVAALVVGLAVACAIAEPCGAAVLAAMAAILSEEALATVLGILAANGVRTAG